MGEPDEENIEICATYLKRMQPLNLILEMEIGITGGAEDGVDNSGVSKEKLYSTPEDVYKVWQGLSPISEKFTIAAALGTGVVKMNVDTDTQWAYWEGVKNFYQAKEGYLQGQIGNPEGPEKPNKSYYDPRKWLREAELTMVKRVQESCVDLSNVN